MHAHRVEVLDRADDHDVVVCVAHDLELELVPADERLLDEHLADRAFAEAALELRLELVAVVRDPAPVTAEGEGRPQDRGEVELRREVLGIGDDHRLRHLEADVAHGLTEELAVLGAANRLEAGADELHPELVENPCRRKVAREVERRLPAESRQERIRPLTPQDGRDRLEVERLDVGPVGEARVGHDRRRVRVDDDRTEALRAENLERLAARVVELAGLPDHDRPRADHADRAEVTPLRQHAPPRPTIRSGSGRRAGPGPASGWNCTERARSPGSASPSTVPS